jgi:hypothetical protein
MMQDACSSAIAIKADIICSTWVLPLAVSLPLGVISAGNQAASKIEIDNQFTAYPLRDL